MSSTSGGSGQKPSTSNPKIKVKLHKTNSSSKWTVVSQKSKRSKNMSSSPISPGLQQIIDNQSLLLPQGLHFNFNNVIEGIENTTDNNRTNLAADKDMELDDLSHHAFDSTIMASINNNQNNSYSIMNNDKALSNVSQSQHTKSF